MRYLTYVPRTVYEALFKFKRHFRCPQGRHFVLFYWIEVALILESGPGTLEDLALLLLGRVRYCLRHTTAATAWLLGRSLDPRNAATIFPL